MADRSRSVCKHLFETTNKKDPPEKDGAVEYLDSKEALKMWRPLTADNGQNASNKKFVNNEEIKLQRTIMLPKAKKTMLRLRIRSFAGSPQINLSSILWSFWSEPIVTLTF